jgi:uncharacterized linocin/CFP29 family protein
MQSLKRVGMDTGRLTNEEILYIDDRVVEAVVAASVARKIFPVFTLPNAGIMTIRGYKRTSMSRATISLYGQGGGKDRSEKASFDVTVPVIEKEFDIKWRDIEASRGSGSPIDTQEAEEAARRVAVDEDALLLSGEYSGFRAMGIEGLAIATGRNTKASAGAWPANSLTDLAAAIAELEADGHTGPYACILRSAYAGKLRQLVANTATKWIDVIQGGKPLFTAGPGGDGIFVSDNLFTSAGATTIAVVIEPSQQNFELVVGEDINTRKLADVRGNLECVTREVVAPRIKRPTSICEITGLS